MMIKNYIALCFVAAKILEKAQLDSEDLYLLATENLIIDQEIMEADR